MRARSSVLTREERDILLLVVQRQDQKHLSNSEIAQRLGLSVNRVKALMHGACVKLEAHNRNEAVVFALIRGEIGVDELLSLDELAETLGSLGPDGLRSIAQLVRQGQEDGRLPETDGRILPMLRRQDGVLTNRERDVIILVARGLANKEIADTLCMSTSAVRTFLNRASTKLGARKRADLITWALRQGEIAVGEIYSLDEMLQGLAPLGAEYIEKMAQFLDRKLGKEPTSTAS